MPHPPYTGDPAEEPCGICYGPRGKHGVKDLCWPCSMGQYGDDEMHGDPPDDEVEEDE